MSEPLDDFSFERFMSDDSLPLDTDTWLTGPIDWDVQLPPVPEEPIQNNHAQSEGENDQVLLSPVRLLRASGRMEQATTQDSKTTARNISSSNDASHKRQAEAKRSQAKPHRCNEPRCGARYARKGDLARHKREEHSEQEYRCPYSLCLWHREGHGFKRLHRLVQHLLSPESSRKWPATHLQAISRLDAQYIAVDYTESYSSSKPLNVDTRDRENAAGVVVVKDSHGQKHDDLAQYATRLVGTHCPETGCPCFIAHPRRSMLGLRKHLMRDHGIEWPDTIQIVKKLADEHWPGANIF